MTTNDTTALKLGQTAAEIAELVGGELQGKADLAISGIKGLREAGPEDLSYLDLAHAKYLAAAAATKAGCVLLPAANRAVACPARARIYVPDTQLALAALLDLLAARRRKAPPGVDPRAQVHPTARLGTGVSVGPFTVIERGAGIGAGTVIDAQCYVGENARVGASCRLYPQVVVREDCVVGDRVILHAGAVVGADGYGFHTDRKTGRHRKIPQLGNVALGDDVELGANTTVDRGKLPSDSTTIGAGTKIDNLVQIGHNCRIGRGCLIVAQVGIAGSTTVGDYVVLGGQVGIAGHLRIGDGVQIGAQSGIMTDVEPRQIVFGYPARPHREAFKLQALYARLPEMHAAIREIRRKLGLGAGDPSQKPEA
ncbi:MAG: UDP-3-O-(3-hydroxymyristoyl)glucosamine N-acyltransferase [Elusimicrobia bacterium]|nr:UDP-3-O-(3-hydroxymyristoyl)glucosamine N-acyltransferase [Elusimicrobiota bacterium]